ncbi:MAG: hypothetical protein ACYTFY_19590 [Planctomycetota bacterium]|jgi:hypothetical protein
MNTKDFTYLTTADDIKNKILDGEFNSGKLPALDKLENENFIYRIDRKGAFVGSRAKILKGKNIIFLTYNTPAPDKEISDTLHTLSLKASPLGMNIVLSVVSSLGEICSSLKETIRNTSASFVIAAGNIDSDSGKGIKALGLPAIFLNELPENNSPEKTAEYLINEIQNNRE